MKRTMLTLGSGEFGRELEGPDGMQRRGRAMAGYLKHTLAAVLALVAAVAFGNPRAEAGGRVFVLDDFEDGLSKWEGDARVELGDGSVKGTKALVWRCTDVASSLVYKHALAIPDPEKYTRIELDIRTWDDDGIQGPGVASMTHMIFGGLPWQLPDMPPYWGLYDYRPVFGDSWRRISYQTHYPEWYNFTVKCDNSKLNFSFRSNAMFAKSAIIMIDNIRLIADVFEVLGKEENGVWGLGRVLPGGDYRYDYAIRLRNLTQEPQIVRATAETPGRKQFQGRLLNAEVRLAPGAEGVISAAVDIPARAAKRLRDLYHEELVVTLAADGAPGTEQTVALLATKPFDSPRRPFLLHASAWWEEERARFAALDAPAREKALAAAGKLLEPTSPFPIAPTEVTRKQLNNGTAVDVRDWSVSDHAVFKANFAAVRTLGEAYQRTRDERYARRAASLMREFADKYARYPWHGNYEISDRGQARIAMNNLHESYWIIDLMGSYDLILDSASLTAEDRERIADRFLRTAARHQTLVCSGFSNMTSTRYTSAAMAGFVLGDANLVQYAVYGHHGLSLSAEVAISTDGFMSEIPVNYHWSNLREMLRLPLVCRNAGLKVDVATERLRKACDTPFLRSMPNLYAPPFGSCGYGIGAPFDLGDYGMAAELFDSPVYRTFADPKQKRQAVDGLSSIVFQEGGLAVLREPGRTGPERTYLAILSSNSRRADNQALHFVLHSDGLLLCPTPGTLYNARGETDWVSPWANTLYVDGQRQRQCQGMTLAHDFSADAQMVLIDGGPLYEGVQLQRAVALAHGLVLIVDRAASDAEHVYERVQMVGQKIVRAPAEQADLERNEGEHIRFKGTRLDDDWSMEWQTTNGPSLRLGMAGREGTEVFWGDNRVNAHKPMMYAPTVLVRRRAMETVFLTVMEPFAGRPARLTAVRRAVVLQGDREAADSQAAAVEAVTDSGNVVFVVRFAEGRFTCQGRKIKAPLTVFRP